MTVNNRPPKYVNTVLSALRTAGFDAYPVGGCVRDMLLSRKPNDWDVCTSALPEDVLAIFPRSHPTGIKHGTVTVVINDSTVEVTTFRTEGAYSDHRHPDSVNFVKDIKLDLARRDFTVNAMALDADGSLIDPFGGQEDLERGIIRCVGNAEERFSEDSLRILRAVRFSARFGFEIEPLTRAAMEKCAPLTHALAAERVQAELEKLLLSPRPAAISTLLKLGILEPYAHAARVSEDRLSLISSLKLSRELRWTALCALLDTDAEAFLRALKLDTKTINCAKLCCELLKEPAPAGRTELKYLLSRCGEETALCYAQVYDMLNSARITRKLREVIASGECCTVKGLRISGRELAALGINGRAVGECLNALLRHVMENDNDNRPDILLSLAGDWRGNNGQL